MCKFSYVDICFSVCAFLLVCVAVAMYVSETLCGWGVFVSASVCLCVYLFVCVCCSLYESRGW